LSTASINDGCFSLIDASTKTVKQALAKPVLVFVSETSPFTVPSAGWHLWFDLLPHSFSEGENMATKIAGALLDQMIRSVVPWSPRCPRASCRSIPALDVARGGRRGRHRQHGLFVSRRCTPRTRSRRKRLGQGWLCARIASMRRPSMSTTSKRQLAHITLSPGFGSSCRCDRMKPARVT
jgi:hypothetical protein